MLETETTAGKLSQEDICGILASLEVLPKKYENQRQGVVSLVADRDRVVRENAELVVKNEDLQRQVEWFKRQLFGKKSEKRFLAVLGGSKQGNLFLGFDDRDDDDERAPDDSVTIKSYQRSKSTAKKFLEGLVRDEGLRFDEKVPVKEIRIGNPAIKDVSPEQIETVAQKESYRLGQLPASYVVIKYVWDVVKLKESKELTAPPAPKAVLEKSYADVSLLAGMLVDKFAYHLPLYRQHQRMLGAGVILSRSTLSRMTHCAVDLLKPIYLAQLSSILQSHVVAMDETPIKASPDREKHEMRTGYFWPIYGEKDEVAFMFAPTRASPVVEKVLKEFVGVLLSDGYKAYDAFAKKNANVVHAQCWVHTRRKFVEASDMEPKFCKVALDSIGKLYEFEETIRKQNLTGDAKSLYRQAHSQRVVDDFFRWLKNVSNEHILLPSNPFTKAGKYALEREAALRVFLTDPEVAPDTNHVERQIRGVAVGRKNWLFCWTEIGAEYAGIVNSLLATCRLHGVDPYTYLVDVLQRVSEHPAFEVHRLTPRLWKQEFAANPMRSDLDTFFRRNVGDVL